MLTVPKHAGLPVHALLPFHAGQPFPRVASLQKSLPHRNKECCSGSKASLQAASAKVSASENDCLLAAAFKEVLQLGISQWKFPANISHKQY